MVLLEGILFWLAVFAYVTSFMVLIPALTGSKERFWSVGQWLAGAGLLFHTVTLGVRWIDAGHIPVTDTYELNLIGTWTAMAIYLLFLKLKKVHRSVAVVLLPVVFLILGYGFVLRNPAGPMGSAFRSPWLIIHVMFAWVAFGCYAVATGNAFLFLLKKWKEKAGTLGEIPDFEHLEDTAYRFVVMGFVNHAVMLVAGAIWAKELWGHYWSWDPLETWSLIAFLFYAVVLHGRSFFNWRGKLMAWLILAGILVLSISFWGVRFFSAQPHPGP